MLRPAGFVILPFLSSSPEGTLRWINPRRFRVWPGGRPHDRLLEDTCEWWSLIRRHQVGAIDLRDDRPPCEDVNLLTHIYYPIYDQRPGNGAGNRNGVVSNWLRGRSCWLSSCTPNLRIRSGNPAAARGLQPGRLSTLRRLHARSQRRGGMSEGQRSAPQPGLLRCLLSAAGHAATATAGRQAEAWQATTAASAGG